MLRFSPGFLPYFVEIITFLLSVSRNPDSTKERPALKCLEAQEAGTSQADRTCRRGDVGAWRRHGAMGDQSFCREVGNGLFLKWFLPNVKIFWGTLASSALVQHIFTSFFVVTEWSLWRRWARWRRDTNPYPKSVLPHSMGLQHLPSHPTRCPNSVPVMVSSGNSPAELSDFIIYCFSAHVYHTLTRIKHVVLESVEFVLVCFVLGLNKYWEKKKSMTKKNACFPDCCII